MGRKVHTFASPPSSSPSTLPIQAIFQSSLFLENLAVRPSSQLLLTSVMSPILHTLDPSATNATLETVHTFPNSTALTGIVEYEPDTYALVASDLNTTIRRAARGSVAIWSANLTSPTPAFSLIASVANLTGANGLSSVPAHPRILLAADSAEGAVWQIDIVTGASRIAIQDAAMAPGAPAPALGINGLHMRGRVLYFTNSQLGTFARVPLTVEDGRVQRAGDVQVLAVVQPLGGGHAFDDFALDREGRAWLAVHPGAVTLVSPSAGGNFNQENVVGVVIQPTSAAFGRGSSVEEKMLYVTTGAGQVVCVDTW
ncbi:hypothetical protein B0H10DRAFT_1861015 [Mycena sp. CBHHK59/15]|nr:hypothetical protein B0H10DRAFT_1861015 [Mycena sp. CBHHK59/15]